MNDEEGHGGGEGEPLVLGGGHAAPAGATSTRDAHLDNCKFFLMLVVVFNHCLQDFLDVVLDPATGRRWCQADPIAPGFYRFVRGVYLYLNLLGMPTFTLISGYCSKGFAGAASGEGPGLPARSRRMVETLLVPWLIWQVFYLLYNYSGVYPVQFWSPIGITWYLTSLFMWRASVQYVARLRYALPLTLALGIGAGFTDTPNTANGLPFLDYQRFLAFMPIFYLGMLAVTAEHMATLRVRAFPWGWVVTAVALTALSATSWGCFDEMQRWVWVMTPYPAGIDSSGGANGWGPVLHASYRAVFYVAALVTGAAFVSIVPSDPAWYTDYGSRTMYAYLLHLLVIRGYMMAQEGWLGAVFPLWTKAVVSGVVLPLATGLGLMAPWCKRWMRHVVEPDCGWLLWVRAEVGAERSGSL